MRDVWIFLRKMVLLIMVAAVVLFIAVPQVSAMMDRTVRDFVKQLFSPFAHVTITAVPTWGSMPPTDFTVQQIGEDIICNWTNSPTGVATMIRAKFGDYPADMTDGYEVFYGAGSTAIDTGVNLDENISTIFYVAYAENAFGVWSTPVSAILEASSMQNLILLGAVLALVVTSQWLRSPVLKITSGAGSLAYGGYFISQNMESYVIIIIGVAFLILGLYQILTSFRN